MILSTIRLILITLLMVTTRPFMNLIRNLSKIVQIIAKKINGHCLSSLIDRYFVVI
jgi:hypothetical protein